MRTRFDRELETLNLELIQMGSLIERSIESTVKALIEKDHRPGPGGHRL